MQKRGGPLPSDKKSSLRLVAVAWPFIAIIVTQAILASFSLQMVTSLRSYVTGESMWSKGQHDAIYFLNRYIDTTQSSYLERHRQALSVPLGDHAARLALEANPPDRVAAAEGFRRGGNHPDDIPGLIWLYENFSWFSYMSAAIADWRNAESTLFEMEELADEMARAALVQPWQRREWAVRLDAINDRVTPLTHAFSNSLGQGTRFVQTSLLIANLAIAALFVALTLWRLNSFLKHRRAIEHELSWRASHDALTKLPNRASFEREVEKALADGSATALLFVDLDQFKVVNDSGGHAAGDQLLCVLAERLPSLLGPGALLARLGGDEFGVLLNTGSVDEGLITAHQLRHALAALPFVWNDQHFSVSASIGFVRLDRSVGSLATALRAADIACYMAKEKGRNRTALFHGGLRERAMARLEVENALRDALRADEMVLHFQPVVRLRDRTMVGVEALLRWERPGIGLVKPSAFVPVATDTGLILPLGRWVIEQASRHAARWPSLEVAANLSARQLADADLVDFVADCLARHRVPPHQLCLEVTEADLVTDPDAIVEQLRRFKELGVRLAIDDFGTGFATLDYLRRFSAADILKVDASFVAGLSDPSSHDLAIVSAALVLADNLGFDTVAEGVETEAQGEVLERLGCELAQGHLFSPSVTAESIDQLLAAKQVFGPPRSGRADSRSRVAPESL